MPPLNKTLAGVLAGVFIGLAGFVGLLSVAALLASQVNPDWDGAWFVLRSVLMVSLFIFGFRYFRARAR